MLDRAHDQDFGWWIFTEHRPNSLQEAQFLQPLICSSIVKQTHLSVKCNILTADELLYSNASSESRSTHCYFTNLRWTIWHFNRDKRAIYGVQLMYTHGEAVKLQSGLIPLHTLVCYHMWWLTIDLHFTCKVMSCNYTDLHRRYCKYIRELRYFILTTRHYI